MSALNLRSVFVVLRAYHFVTALQSADKDQQERRAVIEKPHNAVVKFDTYRNLQRHRAVLPAIARHLVIDLVCVPVLTTAPVCRVASLLYMTWTVCIDRQWRPTASIVTLDRYRSPLADCNN